MPDDVQTQPLLVEIAIEPRSKADQEKYCARKLTAKDPSFRVSTDHESGQAILKGTYQRQEHRIAGPQRTRD